MNFYISDLHIGHENILSIDERPFENLEEMSDTIRENWNSTVSNDDTVYVLGDIAFKGFDFVPYYNSLNGKKILITGNHDLSLDREDLKKVFDRIAPMMTIRDGEKRVQLCHYPIQFYNGAESFENCMLFGHVHGGFVGNMVEAVRDLILKLDMREVKANRAQFYNVGCMLPYMNYTPKTLEQIVNGFEMYRQMGNS